MSEHPTCPTCRMEALRLIGKKHCDWCAPRPGLGRPFNAKAWPSMVEALDRRAREIAAEAERHQAGRRVA